MTCTNEQDDCEHIGFFSVTAHYAVIFALLGGGEGERQGARTSVFAYPSPLLPTPLSPGILVIHFNHLAAQP